MKPDFDDVQFRKEPAVEAACALFKGGYEGFSGVHAALMQWVEDNHAEIIGEPRESYIDGSPESGLGRRLADRSSDPDPPGLKESVQCCLLNTAEKGQERVRSRLEMRETSGRESKAFRRFFADQKGSR